MENNKNKIPGIDENEKKGFLFFVENAALLEVLKDNGFDSKKIQSDCLKKVQNYIKNKEVLQEMIKEYIQVEI